MQCDGGEWGAGMDAELGAGVGYGGVWDAAAGYFDAVPEGGGEGENWG